MSARGIGLLAATLAAVGCDGHGSRADASGQDGSANHDDTRVGIDDSTPIGTGGFPTANAWSWDGSWTPAGSDFPLAGLLDHKYFDGHAGSDGMPTPILPPGAWDYNAANNDLANWRNFAANVGTWTALNDPAGHQYGWQLSPVHPGAVEYTGPALYFNGSTGTDVLELGSMGSLHSFGSGSLGDGPDVLVLNSGYAADFRTGSSATGHAHDDDLLVLGCVPSTDATYLLRSLSFHTGPGRDLAFIREMASAAIDMGNGADGRTDTLDPNDGDDMAVLHGNMRDFRFFGGAGNDAVVWCLDEVHDTSLLGPNFFGGGGEGDALWADPGTDRLVLAISASTPIVTTTPTPTGSLLVSLPNDPDTLTQDAPTQSDPNAAYCVVCGRGPAGQHTMRLEYNSASGVVHTGYFGVTGFEELQVGVGSDAKVYRLDSAAGTATLDATLRPLAPPSLPASFCAAP